MESGEKVRRESIWEIWDIGEVQVFLLLLRNLMRKRLRNPRSSSISTASEVASESKCEWSIVDCFWLFSYFSKAVASWKIFTFGDWAHFFSSSSIPVMLKKATKYNSIHSLLHKVPIYNFCKLCTKETEKPPHKSFDLMLIFPKLYKGQMRSCSEFLCHF